MTVCSWHGGALDATNTIIYGNTVAFGTSSNYSVVETNTYFSFCCSQHTNALPGDNNLNTNPLFAGWANGNYSLSVASPCRNAGTNQAWMESATDLDGFSGRVDMGAYEYLPSGVLFIVR